MWWWLTPRYFNLEIRSPISEITTQCRGWGLDPQQKVASPDVLANMTTLFKKGSKAEPGNYRLVSLTPYLGKILEAILKIYIMRHITAH